jgi:metal-dependent HD superfamily phosphatase/phosphodiesterase
MCCTREAVDIFYKFPNINVAVLVISGDIDSDKIADVIKKVTEKIIVVALSATIGGHCHRADHTLSSHKPEQLVELMRTLLGDPRSN